MDKITQIFTLVDNTLIIILDQLSQKIILFAPHTTTKMQHHKYSEIIYHKWSDSELETLQKGVMKHGHKWKAIQKEFF